MAPVGLDMGQGSEGGSGAFYNHPKLGYSILVNADTAPGRQTFTMAHEFAHALFHYPTVGVISRKGDRDPKERFTDAFAAHFFVPSGALRELSEPSWKENGVEPYRAVEHGGPIQGELRNPSLSALAGRAHTGVEPRAIEGIQSECDGPAARAG
jgi:IrrE N-terminal-like domain